MAVDERTVDDDKLRYLFWLLADLASVGATASPSATDSLLGEPRPDAAFAVPTARVPPSAGEFADPDLLWEAPDALQAATSLGIPTHRLPRLKAGLAAAALVTCAAAAIIGAGRIGNADHGGQTQTPVPTTLAPTIPALPVVTTTTLEPAAAPTSVVRRPTKRPAPPTTLKTLRPVSPYRP